MEKKTMRLVHSVLPIYNEESKILILGTFPSVKSREGEFFYHHPQIAFGRLSVPYMMKNCLNQLRIKNSSC